MQLFLVEPRILQSLLNRMHLLSGVIEDPRWHLLLPWVGKWQQPFRVDNLDTATNPRVDATPIREGAKVLKVETESVTIRARFRRKLEFR